MVLLRDVGLPDVSWSLCVQLVPYMLDRRPFCTVGWPMEQQTLANCSIVLSCSNARLHTWTSGRKL